MKTITETQSILIQQINVGLMANYAYILGSVQTGEAVCIDPAWNAGKLIKAAEAKGLKITRIFLTHTHFDHCNAAGELAQKTGAVIYVHKTEADFVKSPHKQIVPVENGFELELGGFTAKFHHTPGHTPGSQCIEVSGFLFTGDTLFVGNCGRTDLPGSSPQIMFRTMRYLAGLADNLVILPGHDYGSTPTSTLGDEKRTNPCLMGATMKDFLDVD